MITKAAMGNTLIVGALAPRIVAHELNNTRGRFFTVDFRSANGTKCTTNCRTMPIDLNVEKEDKKNCVMTVYNVRKGWEKVPLDRVREVRFKGSIEVFNDA